jgi:meso-butanediol dehydrogenase / (S,S)-butanediol dehydrogenase / diacetyl reductase
MSRFDGKVVLITGGRSAIGLAIARRFAVEGAWCALVGRNLEPVQTAAATIGDTARGFVGDVTDPAAITATVEEVVAWRGRLDVLVTAAGVVVQGGIGEMDLDDYRRVMAGNLDGVFYTIRAALPHLDAQLGCIVTIGSVSALGGDWGQPAYNAAKAGIANLINCLALDHGARVRVNAVHPGATITDEATEAAFSSGTPIAAAWEQRIPQGRVGRPDDVAGVVAFLASDDARHVNGAHIPVDGGLGASNGQPSLPAVLAAWQTTATSEDLRHATSRMAR